MLPIILGCRDYLGVGKSYWEKNETLENHTQYIVEKTINILDVLPHSFLRDGCYEKLSICIQI